VVVAAEEAISESSDDVIRAIAEDGRQQSGYAQSLPGPAQFARDKQSGIAPRQNGTVRRPKVGENIERVQVVGITTTPRNHCLSHCTLKRSESKDGAAVVLYRKPEEAAAKAADAIV
jgi:hypothetical protein